MLEITETEIATDAATCRSSLRDLADLGVRISIDDFGTGYSSLAQLRSFPVDFLKIDKAFIDAMANGSSEAAVVQAIVALAAALGLETIAEGVETVDQMEALRRIGCDQVQGYIVSKPLPVKALEDFLNHPRSTPITTPITTPISGRHSVEIDVLSLELATLLADGELGENLQQ